MAIDPFAVLNAGPELVQDLSKPLPPSISSAVGAKFGGQIGNNPITAKLQDLADNAGLKGPNGQLFQQQSAFPFKKPVSFMLKDRNGNLIDPKDPNFKPGYFFKMRINPSNFSISEPPKTVVPVRTLGGWRVQFWYPEIGSIKADGTIGNMLERYNRNLKDSDAWRNFSKLLTVYRGNGIPYLRAGQDRKALQAAFAPIAVCTFDTFQYEGYFESLEYTESEETPHTIKYSFSFRFLNSIKLDDIPGVTRETAIDAGVFNALVPQQRLTTAINSLKF